MKAPEDAAGVVLEWMAAQGDGPPGARIPPSAAGEPRAGHRGGARASYSDIGDAASAHLPNVPPVVIRTTWQTAGPAGNCPRSQPAAAYRAPRQVRIGTMARVPGCPLTGSPARLGSPPCRLVTLEGVPPMPETARVADHVASGVGHVELNRPGAFNALDIPLHSRLDVVAAASANDEVKVVLLSGRGCAFCAGGASRWWRAPTRW